MKYNPIKLSIFINYVVFAILLNSVGAVILQSVRSFDVSRAEASILEGCKDISIAIASFLLASFLPKIGLKKSMLIGLGLVTIFSVITPLVASSLNYFKILFVIIGISFALIKISSFTMIGLVTKGEKEHASFMGFLEAAFMAGILSGLIIFSYFIDDNDSLSKNWLNFYYILALASGIAFIILYISRLNESEAKIENRNFRQDFIEMIKLFIKPLVIVFIISIFFYVLIEQSFQSWFPTFYKDILHTPASMAVQAGAVLAGAFMTGRLLAGIALKKIPWIYFVSLCLILLAIIVILCMPLAKEVQISADSTWTNAPLVVYLMPIMGIFLAPIYPTLNSAIISSLPKNMHSSMTGLIMVFSALGGTTGAIITGLVFDKYHGTTAFYLTLFPICIVFVLVWILDKQIKKVKNHDK